MSISDKDKKPLIILTGPTAVGKTDLSIKLAKKINGEIISADSMQVYRTMDIGTAKVTKEEMDGIPHHLIDIMEPDEEFNIYKFKKFTCDSIDKIYSNSHMPIIAGGTGFYIQSVLYDIEFDESEVLSDFRIEKEEYAKKYGADALHDELRKVDPVSADAIHPNNVKRVIRALEYFAQNGKPISEHNKEQSQNGSPYNFMYFVLTTERDNLYKRIDKRVDIMLENGLVDEVKRLHEKYHNPELLSMQGIGYKEIIEYLDGKLTLSEATDLLIKNTRHFAKRQLTWFRREKNVTWIDKDKFFDDNEILDYMYSLCTQKGII